MNKTVAATADRAKYSKAINELLGEIKKAMLDKKLSDEHLLIDLQVQLDTIADVYQDDTSLGKSRAKMYLIQAILHYYSDKPSLSWQYLQVAEEINGAPFELSEKLKAKLEAEGFDQADTTPALDQITAVQPASSTRRFLNYLIDLGLIYLLFGILIFVDALRAGVFVDTATGELNGTGYLLYFGLFIAYYLFSEYAWGRSLAKFITSTKVVTADGDIPAFKQLLGRTLSRFIPFEAFSFLGKNPVGWHDSLSGTRVVRK